jgi:hypothetical protein
MQMVPPGDMQWTPCTTLYQCLILNKVDNFIPERSPVSSDICMILQYLECKKCPLGYVKQSFTQKDINIQILAIRQTIVRMI